MLKIVCFCSLFSLNSSSNFSSLQLSQIEHMEKQLQTLQTQTNPSEQINFSDIIKQINQTLQNQWNRSLETFEQTQTKHRQLNEFIKQIEDDIDNDIQSTKNNYENQLTSLRQYANQLTNNVSTLRKQYNTIISQIQSRDLKRNTIENEVNDLENRQMDLIDKLDHFRFSNFSSNKKKSHRRSLCSFSY